MSILPTLALNDRTLFSAFADPPIDTHFAVQIDAIPGIQMWNSIDGLKIQLQTASNSTGKSKNPTPVVPKRAAVGLAPGVATSGALTLKRPLGPSSKDVYKWIQNTAQAPITSTGSQAHRGAAILLFDWGSRMYYEWTLYGIIPTGWSIATFTAGSAKIVEETLNVSYSSLEFTVDFIPAFG